MRDRCNYSAGSMERTSEPEFSGSVVRTTDLSPGCLDAPGLGTVAHARQSPLLQGQVSCPPIPSPASMTGVGGSYATTTGLATGPSPSAAAASLIDSMTVVEDGPSTIQYFGSSSTGSFTQEDQICRRCTVGNIVFGALQRHSRVGGPGDRRCEA